MTSTADHFDRMDHVALVVPDLRAATVLYVDALGATFLTGGDNDDTGLRLVHLALGGFKIELIEAFRSGSLLAPWLEKHGPGIHHITYVVDDVDATARSLEADAVPVVGVDTSSPNWSEAFIHPHASGSALVQFVTTALDWGEPTEDFTLQDVLDGRIVWRDSIPCLRDA